MIPKIRACCRLFVKGSAAFCFSLLLLLSMRVFGLEGSRMATLVIKIRRRLSYLGFRRLTMAATGLSLHGRWEVFHCTETAACFSYFFFLHIFKATEYYFNNFGRMFVIDCDMWCIGEASSFESTKPISKL